MLEKKQVYKCEVCGNVVEGLWDGEPSVHCCGKPMTKLEANTVDAAREKHVPVVERDGNSVTVTVGSVDHPMSPEHYILFIELLVGQDVYRHDFKEGDSVARATFTIEDAQQDITARAFCNLHGLWASK